MRNVILPELPSDELKLMKKKFAEMNEKFDRFRVINQFPDFENLFKKTELRSQYMEHEISINTSSYKLQFFLLLIFQDQIFTQEISSLNTNVVMVWPRTYC